MRGRRENKGRAYEGGVKEKQREARNERKIQIRKTRGEEVRLGSQKRGKESKVRETKDGNDRRKTKEHGGR